VQVHELNADLAPYFKVEKKGGVLISEVMEDSPAQQAGLKAGDVITKIHDQKISDPEDLFDALDGYEGGDKITVEYIRKGAAGMLEVELDDTGFREFRIRGRHRDNLRILHLEDMPRIPASPRSPVIINDHRRPGYSI